jgi:hypothetical protein
LTSRKSWLRRKLPDPRIRERGDLLADAFKQAAVHAELGKDRYGPIAKTNITDGHRAAFEALVSGV